MFISGVTSTSEVTPGGALHGDFSGGLVIWTRLRNYFHLNYFLHLQDPALLGILSMEVTVV